MCQVWVVRQQDVLAERHNVQGMSYYDIKTDQHTQPDLFRTVQIHIDGIFLLNRKIFI